MGGTAVWGSEFATKGNTIGVRGYVDSRAGTAGVFNNAAGGMILNGQNNGASKFSVDGQGNVNIAGNQGINGHTASYSIGGGSVVSIGFNPWAQSLFLGWGAGSGDGGAANTFTGYQAGSNNMGTDNTFSGHLAGAMGGSGSWNAFYGASAGYSNGTGFHNTFSGDHAGYTNTSGYSNTFYGFRAGYRTSTGNWNTFLGSAAGYHNTTGFNNTFSGYQAGSENTTGSGNTFLGAGAGIFNTTGNSDIYIKNPGVSSGAESNTIRIGTQGTGDGQQNAAYVAGIFGSTVGGDGVPVYIDSNGQLGTAVSSLRFKQQVRDMGDSTNALLKLQTVVAAQQDVIKSQQEQIINLQQRLARLEALAEKK